MRIYVGRLDRVQLLLDSGYDPTPGLSEAIVFRRNKIAHLLLAFGARYKVNARSGLDLYKACEVGDSKLVKVILDAGVDVAACRGNCMKLACRMGKQFALRLSFVSATHFAGQSRLFENGANPSGRRRCPHTGSL